MKALLLAMLILPGVVHGGDTNVQARAPGGKWDSPARLEFIAKTYAKEHKIDFDFSHTERHVYMEKRGTNTFATIAFYQGMGKLVFEADIDRSGKVLRHAVTKVIEGPRRDQP